MSDTHLDEDPLLHKQVLDELRRILGAVFPSQNLSRIFSNHIEWHGKTYRRLYNFHPNNVVSEIPIPKNTMLYIRDKIVIPYIKREGENARLTEEDIDAFDKLVNRYHRRISTDDGRRKSNCSTPEFWKPNGDRIWNELIKRGRVTGLQLRDRDVALEFILSFTDRAAFQSSFAEARTNAWVIAHAISRHRNLFPQDDEEMYQLQAFACTRGIYHAYVTDDIRSMVDFRRILKRIKTRTQDSLPSIGLNMSAFYENKVLNGFIDSTKKYPCTEVIKIYKESRPAIYDRMGWNFHAHFRHLNDEMLLQGASSDDTIALRGGITLAASLKESIKVAHDLRCNECYIGTQVSLALHLADRGDIHQADAITTNVLKQAVKLERINPKTKAHAHEVAGNVKNKIDRDSGNMLLLQAKEIYSTQKARFSVWSLMKKYDRQ